MYEHYPDYTLKCVYFLTLKYREDSNKYRVPNTSSSKSFMQLADYIFFKLN